MKDDLKDWLNLVSTQRKSVYILNYFTCLQLLQISNELYCLITDPDHQINKKILLLLMSISPDLTIENIKNVTSSPEAKKICSASNSSLPLSSENYVFNDLDEIDLPTEVDMLSDEERTLYLSFTQDNDDFNPYMILTAIRRFGLDEERILDFCADSNTIQAFGNDPVSTTHNDDHQESRIDITNPTVQELIRCNFSESSAIDAVSKCGEEIEDCMDYLVEQTLKDNSNERTSEDNVDLNIVANSNRPQSSNISSQ